MELRPIIEKWMAMLPLSEQDQYRLSQRFTIDFNYNSNHIEGSTLTYGQTELLLLFGKIAGEAEMKDLEEMKASAVGLKMMEVEALTKDLPLTQNFIRQLHKVLLQEDYKVYRKLPGGEYTSYVVHAGQYKTRPNSVITRTGERFEYASPEETPALMTDLVDWYNEEEKKGAMSPIELATLFHYRYMRIHPFEDGNGRIARLLVNYILSRHGYPMIVVRSRKKQDYLAALSDADKIVGKAPSKGAKASLREIRHFLQYMKNLVAEEVSNDILFLTRKSENIWWYDGEMVEFKNETASKIINAILLNPSVTNVALAKMAGVNPSVISKHLKKMTDKQYIQRKLDGSWHVIIRPSI